MLVTNDKQEPILIVTILTARERDKHSSFTLIVFVWADLIKTILTWKLKEMFSEKGFKEFRFHFLEKTLGKIEIKNEEELFEKFPNVRELIILLNDTNRTVDINIHDEVTIPKIFSSI